jgi:hypothetical protein
MTEDREPDLTEDELELFQQLADERGVPRAAFRGALTRLMRARDPGYGHRPARMRLLVAGLIGWGAVILTIGALVALRGS